LLSLFATGFWPTVSAVSGRAAGTLSRPRMLVAAAPTTRKQVMAMMVMILVKPFPDCIRDPVHFPENWALIKA
jgi:hypothetical protein